MILQTLIGKYTLTRKGRLPLSQPHFIFPANRRTRPDTGNGLDIRVSLELLSFLLICAACIMEEQIERADINSHTRTFTGCNTVYTRRQWCSSRV
jgi:hypothetical protein